MRDWMFFNSDVASKAEELAYPLATDYGLDDEQAEELAADIEEAVLKYFAPVREYPVTNDRPREHELNLMNERTAR